MKEWIPLLQTLVWPIFILFFFYYFRGGATELLAALIERVKAGASLELPGGVKVGEMPRSLDDDKLHDKITSAVTNVLRAEVSGERLNDLVHKFEQQIEEAFLTIDSKSLLGSDVEPWKVPYRRFRTVSALLNDIWATIRDKGHYLPSLSLGSAWVLEINGKYLTEQNVGIRWARKHGKDIDDRPLQAVGIEPGMTLKVVPPTKASNLS